MQRLIQARLRQGWTQADLAEKMGVATKTVVRWEAGTTIPQPGLRAKLGALLQIDPEEIWSLQPILPDPTTQLRQRVDWGEAPHPEQLYGRNQELAALSHWMIKDSCRFVAILGMGGIGKTSLAATVVEQVLAHYDCVFWRSLHNTPPFKQVLQECLQLVSPQQHIVFPEGTDNSISLLIEPFRLCRCLFVLDNVESILQGRGPAGVYRDGYEGYGRLFQRMGEGKHQSCLLVTSREKPPEVAFKDYKGPSTTGRLSLATMGEIRWR
jgi:DNA-binding XRE family transcriptional regulator